MSVHGGPLPGARPRIPVGLDGWWRAVVERVDPLEVSVPALTGQGFVKGRVEAVPGLDLEVGSRVWVAGVEGSRTQLVVTALRA